MFETYTKHETFVETWMAKWQKFWFLSLSESDRSQCSATHLASSFTIEVHLLTQKKELQVRKMFPQVTNDLC
jgi:hypothetical protein